MCGALASLAAHSCCCPAPGQQGDTGLITDDNCCSCNLAAMKEVPSRNIYCENYREISLRLTPLLVPGAPQQADRDRVRQLPRGCGRDSLLHQRGLRQARDRDHHPRNPLHEGGYLESTRECLLSILSMVFPRRTSWRTSARSPSSSPCRASTTTGRGTRSGFMSTS